MEYFLQMLYQAAQQGAVILNPELDEETRVLFKKEMETCLKEYLESASINMYFNGISPVQQLAANKQRAAAYLLMMRAGASPVMVARGAATAEEHDFNEFLVRNYGVVPHERVLPKFDLNLDITNLMAIIPTMSVKQITKVAYDAASLGYSNLAYQLSLMIEEISPTVLAQKAAEGSHYRLAEQMYTERQADMSAIVQGALTTTDFQNPAIALFNMSFMGTKFRADFGSHLEHAHHHDQLFNLRQLFVLAENIAKFMKDGFYYEKALLLAVSQTPGESLYDYCQAESKAGRGTDLFNHMRVLKLFKECLEKGDIQSALKLMMQFSKFPAADMNEFFREIEQRKGLLNELILRGSIDFVAFLFQPNSPFDCRTALDNAGNTIFHLLSATEHGERIFKLYKDCIPLQAFRHIEITNAHGHTALETAATRGALEVCKYLLKHGASISLRLLDFHLNPKVAKIILEDSYLKSEPGDSPKAYPIAMPYQPLIKFVLDSQKKWAVRRIFDFDTQFNKEVKFAHFAITKIANLIKLYPSKELLAQPLELTVRYLMRMARLNNLVSDKKTEFSTAFEQFCKVIKGNPEELLDTNPLGNTPYHQFAEMGDLASLMDHGDLAKYITSRNALGETLLHKAAANGHAPCCNFLIQQGVSITARAADGRLAIEVAEGPARDVLLNAFNDAAKARTMAAIHTLDTLGIIKGASINWASAEPEKIELPELPSKISDLHIFISKHPNTSQAEFAHHAISLIAHILNAPQGYDKEDIDAAIQHLEIVAEAKHTFDVPLLFGDTTEDLVVAFEFFKYHLKTMLTAQSLCSAAAASEEDDEPKFQKLTICETPLHIFAREGKTHLLKLACELGIVDIHELNEAGETPLDVAVNHDHARCCAVLMDHGATMLWKSSDGRTTKDLAKPKVQSVIRDREKTRLAQDEVELKPMRSYASSQASSGAAAGGPMFFSPLRQDLLPSAAAPLAIPDLPGFTEIDLSPDAEPYIFGSTTR